MSIWISFKKSYFLFGFFVTQRVPGSTNISNIQGQKKLLAIWSSYYPILFPGDIFPLLFYMNV
jgi:hypothetical protein